MPASPRARRARLALQPLETRDTPNGTVFASVTGGILTLTGDDLDNSIGVEQTGPGSFTVSGVNTTIQGGPNFTGVTGIVANLADGNDVAALYGSVDQDLDGLMDFILPGSVTFNAGDGSNVFGLTGSGKIEVGAFSYTGGDGPDVVQVFGGVGKASKVAGNMSIAVGIGFNSQGPFYADTQINLNNLEINGLGGLKVTGSDGHEMLNLTDVSVARALTADGGADNLTVSITRGTFGTLNLKSAGPSAGYSTNALSLSATNTHMTGPVLMKSATGASLYLAGSETGPITLTSGGGGFAGASVEVAAGTSTVHGDLKVTGNRLAVYTRTGAILTVDRALSVVGRGFVDLNLGDGSSVKAATATFTGTSGAGFFCNESSTSRVLTVTGAMTLKGWTADFYQVGGDVQIGGMLSVIATTHASFRTDVSYGFNTPRANIKAGSLLLQGRSADYTQIESDATFATGLSVIAKEDAAISGYGREQTEDPANPGTYDPSIGSTITVTSGSLLLSSATTSAEMFQGDGVLTLGGGLTILAPGGSASYRAEAGGGFNAPAPKLVMPAGNVLIRGGSADFAFAGGVATVGGTMTILGRDGASFESDFDDTYDFDFNFIDLFPTFTTGTVTVNAGVGDAHFATFGDTFTGHGNVLVKGAGLTRVYFDDETGSQVDGDVSVTSRGDFDSFLVWGPLTIGGNLTVDLGNGSNGFETGIYGGTTKVTGNVTFKSGNGSDTYALARLEVTGTTTITTGAGTDWVYLLGGSKFTGPATVDTGGGADVFAAGTELPDAQIPPGPALFPPGTVQFDAKATIKLGAGNDTMRLGVAGDPEGKVVFGPAGSVAADGGLSLGDTFDPAAGQFDAAKVTAIGFELP